MCRPQARQGGIDIGALLGVVDAHQDFARTHQRPDIHAPFSHPAAGPERQLGLNPSLHFPRDLGARLVLSQ
ncbi:MAG: hypothetical protein E5X84_28120 [Mesorhizobium sp.]|nr:MAG: hypothetical protein E5X84_28120 [Mesorhizobium sp.]